MKYPKKTLEIWLHELKLSIRKTHFYPIKCEVYQVLGKDMKAQDCLITDNQLS